MKLFQKSPFVDKTSSLLRVNTDTFAELMQQTDDAYIFNVSFKLAISSGRKLISEYSKVVITVKRKQLDYLKANSNYVKSALPGNKNELQIADNLLRQVKPSNGLSTPKLTQKVASRLYSGLKIIKDIEAKEDFIEQITVPVSTVVEDNLNNKFNYTELFSTSTKVERKTGRQRNVDVTNNKADFQNQISTINLGASKVDPTNTIERVNAELCDITLPVSDPELSILSSESYIDDFSTRLREISKGKCPLYYDIIKYYLDDVNGSPQEEKMQWYQSRNVTKFLDDIDFTQSLIIKKGNKNQNLTVRFDLYKKESEVIDETFSCDLFVTPHVEAFECVTKPPVVSAVKLTDKLYNLTITDVELGGRIQSFNVYAKDVTPQGTVSSYRKLANIKNDGAKVDFILTSELTVIRVIPVDSQSRESNVYTNIIVGPGHKVIGNLTILPMHFGKNQIKVEVTNIPRDAVTVTLFRRDCTDNPNNSFLKVSDLKLDGGNINVDLIDSDVLIGRIYEYYAIALSSNLDTKIEIPVISNYVMFKNMATSVVEKSINVMLTDALMSTHEEGYKFTFKLKTDISKSENEKITQTLKDQIGELYDQYLNPATNNSSPLGEDLKGIPQYSDLFFHEVIRTNLNTAERETFELIPDGIFEDKLETQQLFNIKSINPQHSYYYQVFTYKKNPIELFKKFVAWGIDNKGKEWFYLPYKWKNPVVKLGKLYADDSTGTPVIDAYENFTSEAFGMTASFQTDGSREYTSLINIMADRIDRNTVKVSWDFSSNDESLYDSFIVMKVVNGIRSFVGRTHKKFIYHELSNIDLGTIYYIIVPIMSEFDIDDPGYSNHVFISPDGLTTKSHIRSVKSSLSNYIENSKIPKSGVDSGVVEDNLMKQMMKVRL